MLYIMFYWTSNDWFLCMKILNIYDSLVRKIKCNKKTNINRTYVWIILDSCGSRKPVWLNIVPSYHFPAYRGQPVHHCPGYDGAEEQHTDHDSSGLQQQCDHHQEHHILQTANESAGSAKPDRRLWVQHQITARPLLGDIRRSGMEIIALRDIAGIHEAGLGG